MKRAILIGLSLIAWDQAYSVTCALTFRSDAFTQIPSSRDDINAATHAQFTEFATNQTTHVLESLRNGTSISDILTQLATARRALAQRLNQPNSNKYGSLRTQQPDADSTIAVSNVPQSTYLALLEKYNLIDPLDYRERFTTYYKTTTTNFERYLEASRVTALENQPNIFVVHPGPIQTQRIFDDVIQRAENYKRANNPSKKEFLEIAYGFFVAMPYQRGSAAIGRIFLEALYFHVNNRAANLPADVDILALLLPEEHFVTELTSREW